MGSTGLNGVTSPLQPVFDAVNGPVQSLTGRLLIGNGANAAPGSGLNGAPGGWLLGSGGAGGSGAPAPAGPAVSAGRPG